MLVYNLNVKETLQYCQLVLNILGVTHMTTSSITVL